MLRMLVGLLHPTSGRIRVAGREPARRERDFLGRIMLVAGQRQQLVWDLPALETWKMHQVLYGIDPAVYEYRVGELVAMLEVSDVMRRPVRELSLGERMRCELVAGLLHQPRILFLDEPTIGLDLAAQHAFRTFLRTYQARTKATVVLTSHDPADVEAICTRVLLMDRGKIVWDGPRDELVRRVRPQKEITLTSKRPLSDVELGDLGEVLSLSRGPGGDRIALRIEHEMLPALLARLGTLPIDDLTIANASFGAVLATLFARDEAVPSSEAAHAIT
jgi:ABC-2 type transport system ATP-binding protein